MQPVVYENVRPTLLASAKLAQASYDRTWAWGQTIWDDTTDTLCRVGPCGEVVFTGSQSMQNWINDFKFWPRQGIHYGFRKCFHSIKDSLYRSLLDVRECTPVFVGHSLGGALAAISYDVFSQAFKGCRLITFGAPPYLLRGVRRVSGNKLRVTHGMDIVPNLCKIIYGHDGTHIHITDHNGVYVNPGPGRLLLRSIIEIATAHRDRGVDAFMDHDMDRYIGALSHGF